MILHASHEAPPVVRISYEFPIRGVKTCSPITVSAGFLSKAPNGCRVDEVAMDGYDSVRENLEEKTNKITNNFIFLHFIQGISDVILLLR